MSVTDGQAEQFAGAVGAVELPVSRGVFLCGDVRCHVRERRVH
jgi:hypothetical protein